MNEIERRIKENEDNTAVSPIHAKWILVVVAIGLVTNYFDLFDQYYQGEELSTIVSTIERPPEFVDEGQSGTDRYSFKTREHSARFWVMGGALNVISKSDDKRAVIENLKRGQKVTLEIHRSDIESLEKGENGIPVIGLKLSGKQIIDPKQTMDTDASDLAKNLTIGAILFFAMLLVLNWKSIMKIWS